MAEVRDAPLSFHCRNSPFGLPSGGPGQRANGPSQRAKHAQALKATYDQAMQAKDWPAALSAAQQLVDASATSANLFLLGNAQLYAAKATDEEEASLATYDRALAAAEQEKPAQGQSDTAGKTASRRSMSEGQCPAQVEAQCGSDRRL